MSKADFKNPKFSSIANPPRSIYIGERPRDIQTSDQFLKSLNGEINEFFAANGSKALK